MLKQLLKYEFQATRSYYGTAYLALLASALLLGAGAGHMPQIGGTDLDALWALMALVYMGTILAIIVLTIQQIIERFTGNLLGREGYLMHTLPVTPAQLILSKLLSSAVWGICSLCVGVLSVGVLMLSSQPSILLHLGELWHIAVELPADFPQGVRYVTALAAGAFLMFLAWAACQVLRVYACCMVGHQAPRHMAPVGIVSFVLLTSAQGWLEQLVSAGGAWLLVRTLGQRALDFPMPGQGPFWLYVAAYILLQAVFGGIYFLATDWLMRKRLNLE